jgi:hypothetical protein
MNEIQMEHPQVSSDDQLTVPADNEPGHHPEHEQDQPDPDAFVSRFGAADHDSAAGLDPSTEHGMAEGRDGPGAAEELLGRLEGVRARVGPMLRDLRAFAARLLRRAAELVEPGGLPSVTCAGACTGGPSHGSIDL